VILDNNGFSVAAEFGPERTNHNALNESEAGDTLLCQLATTHDIRSGMNSARIRLSNFVYQEKMKSVCLNIIIPRKMRSFI